MPLNMPAHGHGQVNDIPCSCEPQPRGLPAAGGRHVHPAWPRSLRLALRVSP